MKEYLVYKCNICNCEFILPKQYVKINQSRDNYISCPYRGHKQIIVTGSYDNLKDCMDHDSHKKINGKIVQKRWAKS